MEVPEILPSCPTALNCRPLHTGCGFQIRTQFFPLVLSLIPPSLIPHLWVSLIFSTNLEKNWIPELTTAFAVTILPSMHARHDVLSLVITKTPANYSGHLHALLDRLQMVLETATKAAEMSQRLQWPQGIKAGPRMRSNDCPIKWGAMHACKCGLLQ